MKNTMEHFFYIYLQRSACLTAGSYGLAGGLQTLDDDGGKNVEAGTGFMLMVQNR